MSKQYPFVASFLQALRNDLKRETLPTYITPLEAPICAGDWFVIDWRAACQGSFFRIHRGPDIDEAPASWGNTVPLQLMLAVGVEDLSPLLSKQLYSLQSYFYGYPHSSDRFLWEKESPLPERLVRRFRALRRKAFLWMERDPVALNKLIERFERLTHPALYERGFVRAGEHSTTFNLDKLKELGSDPRRTPTLSLIPTVHTLYNQDELDAILHQERHGVVVAFPDTPSLHRNYVFIKFTTYVLEAWDLQEDTPWCNFSRMSHGQPCPPELLEEMRLKAKLWLDQQLTPAGVVARDRVLKGLGLIESDDFGVYYRIKPRQAGTLARKKRVMKVYSVKVPPDVASSEVLRVRVYLNTLYLNTPDLFGNYAKARSAYAENTSVEADKTKRFREFRKLSISAGELRMTQIDAVMDSLLPLPMRAWLTSEFNISIDDWKKKADKEESGVKREQRRRVRKIYPFSQEEDATLIASIGHKNQRGCWSQHFSAWPHHSSRRIRDRGLLLRLFVKKKIPLIYPLTAEYVVTHLGEDVLKTYRRAL